MHGTTVKKGNNAVVCYNGCVSADLGLVQYLVVNIQRDSRRWTQFRKSIFPELCMVCE